MTAAIKDLSRRTDAELNIVCFPYACAGPGIFRSWAAPLAPYAVYAAHLRGREERLTEPPLTDLPTQVGELADAIRPLSRRPLLLFGHSLGATLAAHVAQALFPAMHAPAALIVAARTPPWHQLQAGTPVTTLTDDDLIALLLRTGGLDQRVAACNELMQMLLPAVRADAHLAEAPQQLTEGAIDARLVALWGSQDPHVRQTQAASWQRLTRGPFTISSIDGGHLFLDTNPADVLRHIRREAAHLTHTTAHAARAL